MSIYQQYVNFNTHPIPKQMTISCKSLSKSKQKVLRNMLNKAQTQKMFKPEVKLFSPLVYDYMMRVSKNKRLSFQTVCVGLYILDSYCHCVGYDCEIGVEKLQDVANASLQISVDINQKNSPDVCPYRNSQKSNKYCEIKKLKLRILQKLDWQVNYISFISLGEFIMDEYKNQLTKYLNSHDDLKIYKQKYCKIDQYIMSQIEIILEQFWFLHLSVKECAQMLIQRVLGNFNLGAEVLWDDNLSGQINQGDKYFKLKIWVRNKNIQTYNKQQLGSIQNEDQLGKFIPENKNQRADKQCFQLTQKKNRNQIKPGCLFSSIKPLKQSNKQQKNPLKSTIINSHQFYNQLPLSHINNSISITINKNIQTKNPQIPDNNNFKSSDQSLLMKKSKLCQFREMVLKNKLSNKNYQVGLGIGHGNTLITIFNQNKIVENCNSGQSTLLQLSSCKENNNSGMSTRYSSFQ